jgi:hypothetical protein
LSRILFLVSCTCRRAGGLLEDVSPRGGHFSISIEHFVARIYSFSMQLSLASRRFPRLDLRFLLREFAKTPGTKFCLCCNLRLLSLFAKGEKKNETLFSA